ncbi:MAG: efflux RND transporter periplasmic adaptor subunit [Candidatus Berkiellales bacterium]
MARWLMGSILFFMTCLANATELLTTVATVKQLPLDRWFDGTVEAVKQATVSAETKGRVAEIMFDIGDTVPAGGIILTLVSNEQREVLNQAEAKLSEARANFEADTKEYERIQKLYQQNIISKSDWDKITARFNVSKAQVASAESGLKTAKEQLSYTQIRAPYGGVVSARHVELGEAVFPGKSLMSGFDPKSMRVHVDLPQAIADKVRTLKKAHIVGDDGGELTPSKIILYPNADPATSTVRVRLELPEMNTHLYPGEFVKVAFTIGDVKRLLIPAASIVYRSEVSGVYVINKNIPNLRQVRLGNQFDKDIEVLAGLLPGELVAIDPVAAGIALHNAPAKEKQ